MIGADRTIWFAGDLSDPVVGEIAGALPGERTRWLDSPADLPRPWPTVGSQSPQVVVVHRSLLGDTDAGRLARLKRRLRPEGKIILCVGPHVRYVEIERWLAWVDAVLPEAAAVDAIARQVAEVEGLRPCGMLDDRPTHATGRTIGVASTNTELRSTWRAILQAGGYSVVDTSDPESLPDRLVTLWDVPILEANWANRLAARKARGPVIAAIGFLDWTTRSLALAAGASACLDLPTDLADLVMAVDKVSGVRRDLAHPSIHVPNFRAKPARRAKR